MENSARPTPRYTSGPPVTPTVAADVIIEIGERIVLIERSHPPLGWALPGGFMERGELAVDAARREAKEETGLDVEMTHLLGVYSDPARDPRGHTISLVYIGTANGTPKGGDDAKHAELFLLSALPQLAFDHGKILDDYVAFKRTGKAPPLGR